MKKNFQSSKIQIIQLAEEDVIVTSVTFGEAENDMSDIYALDDELSVGGMNS